jgi:ribosome-associated heat shock protein Hsp15
MRIDKLLWYLRFARSRSIARAMAEDGHIRLNGRRIERSACRVAVGDVLTIPLGRGVQVIEVLQVPERRGPAPEARGCYRTLDAAGNFPIAAPNNANEAVKGDLQP